MRGASRALLRSGGACPRAGPGAGAPARRRERQLRRQPAYYQPESIRDPGILGRRLSWGHSLAQTIVLSDPGMGVYKKLVIADDRLLGAVLFGDTTDGPWYLELMRSRSSIERLRDHLMFGRELADRIAA